MPRFLLVFLLIPLLFARCSNNNVTEDDSLKRYFDSAGVHGTFALFDNKHGQFTIYNLSRYRDSSFLPGETFALLESLIAIQRGTLKDENALLSGRPDSPDLREAFRSPAGAAGFIELSARLGADTLKKWVDSLQYGNMDTTGGAGRFWSNDHLRISPDEELGLVKKLYFDQLPFFARTQKIVRDMMLMENNANYKLSYKAGGGIDRDGHSVGWVVGWIEENKHVYFFVLNTASPDPQKDSPEARTTILRDILKQLGFFQGKK